MIEWKYTIRTGKNLREAIDAGDVNLVVRCLIVCYHELFNRLSDEDKGFCEIDIEDAIFNLESFDQDEDVDEDVDEYLAHFYDLCDDLGAWVEI